jgi:hypothetical protein
MPAACAGSQQAAALGGRAAGGTPFGGLSINPPQRVPASAAKPPPDRLPRPKVLHSLLGEPFAPYLPKVQLLNAKPENVRTEAQVRRSCLGLPAARGPDCSKAARAPA